MPSTGRYHTAAVIGATFLPGSTKPGLTIAGPITRRTGAELTVDTALGPVAVRLYESTEIQSTKGILGLRTRSEPTTSLVEGLQVSVNGVRIEDRLDATTVTFKAADLVALVKARTGRTNDPNAAQQK